MSQRMIKYWVAGRGKRTVLLRVLSVVVKESDKLQERCLSPESLKRIEFGEDTMPAGNVTE